MTTLTITERARLARRGMVVCIEYSNGLCKVACGDHHLVYRAEDLRKFAQPGIGERLRNWLAGRAA